MEPVKLTEIRRENIKGAIFEADANGWHTLICENHRAVLF